MHVQDSQHLLETKNTWARDDPAILVLIAACLTGTTWVPCPCSHITIPSCCHCLGNCIQNWSMGNSQPCFVYDLTRFLIVWNHHCDNPMVSFWYLISCWQNLDILQGLFPTGCCCHHLHIRHQPTRSWSTPTYLMFTQTHSFLYTSHCTLHNFSCFP